MNNNSIAKAFEINHKPLRVETLSDYEIFPDKELLETLRTKIIENISDKNIPNSETIEEFINNEIENVIEGYNLSNLERSHIYNLIDDEINGYGPITAVLKDDNVTEIMVNSPKEIYIEIDGNLIHDEGISFINDDHIMRTITRLIGPLGRTLDAKNPMVDSRLADGSRINAIIPPLSTKGPVITIRKFKRNITTIDDFIRNGTLTPYMARFLSAAIEAKLNILISGGTGSGKTTLLNILSNFISEDERVITIEDAAELNLELNHVISLETKPANYEEQEEITIRDLVRNSLRMRPDRIIIGEVRGGEAFDMLGAMNTGHKGSLTTIHANSPIDALNRLETLVLLSGMEIPIAAVREYIYNAIDLVIHIERLANGSRKIVSISEIVSISDTIKLKEIFTFKQKGITETGEINGEFILHKYVPKVYTRFTSLGINSIDDIFKPFIK